MADLEALDQQRLFHPNTNLAAYHKSGPLVLSRGEVLLRGAGPAVARRPQVRAAKVVRSGASRRPVHAAAVECADEELPDRLFGTTQAGGDLGERQPFLNPEEDRPPVIVGETAERGVDQLVPFRPHEAVGD